MLLHDGFTGILYNSCNKCEKGGKDGTTYGIYRNT